MPVLQPHRAHFAHEALCEQIIAALLAKLFLTSHAADAPATTYGTTTQTRRAAATNKPPSPCTSTYHSTPSRPLFDF